MNILKKILKILLIISHGLFSPSFIFAETVVLKSGQTLDTKIIEKTDKYIKVEVDSAGTVLRYPLEQIESIDGERLESISKPDSAALQQVNKQNKTTNLIAAFKQGVSEGRIKANEDAAYQLCEVYAKTFEVYKQRNQSYPAGFKDLDDKGYLSPSDPYNRLILRSKPAQGYYYNYSYINANHFILEAKPAQQGVTGIKTFRVDETGVVNAFE